MVKLWPTGQLQGAAGTVCQLRYAAAHLQADISFCFLAAGSIQVVTCSRGLFVHTLYHSGLWCWAARLPATHSCSQCCSSTSPSPAVQVRILVHGQETVLGDAAADSELFVTDDYEDVGLAEVVGLAAAKRLVREFDPDLRGRQFKEDEALRKANAEAKAAGG